MVIDTYHWKYIMLNSTLTYPWLNDTSPPNVENLKWVLILASAYLFVVHSICRGWGRSEDPQEAFQGLEVLPLLEVLTNANNLQQHEEGLKIIQACLGCIAQRKHSCFPPSSPGFESCLYRDFFPLLLSLWTVLRSNPSSAKKQISQMRLAVTSRANHYKNIYPLVIQCSKSHQFEVVWQ